MDLLRRLNLADWISLSGLVFIWAALVNILNNQPFAAIFFSLLAFLVDLLDGYFARRRQVSTTFGLHLDTVIDAINYPVFNALFAYRFFFTGSIFGWPVALLILTFSALRLGRMATKGILKDNLSRSYYQGIITPYISLATILIYFFGAFVSPVPTIIITLILGLLALLMVSQIKIYKPKSYLLIVSLTLILVAVSLYGHFYL